MEPIHNYRSLGKTKYKHVFLYQHKKSDELIYRGCVSKYGKCSGKSFEQLRDAALFVDKFLITKGEAPVNILKPVKR